MIKKGLFAFSADPITYGHIDIIIKASKKVQLLYVVIAYNHQKKYLLSLTERVYLVEAVFEKYPNIKVISYTGLLVDLMLKENITHYFRGIRNKADKQKEKIVAVYNKKIFPTFKIIYLKSSQYSKHISSTAVKNLNYFTTEISEYVPTLVKRYLEQKRGMMQIAVTGSIASGKTLFCQTIKQHLTHYLSHHLTKVETENLLFDFKQFINKIHYIDFDQIIKMIYADLAQDKLPLLKERLLKQFKNKILSKKEKIKHKISIDSIRDYILAKERGIFSIDNSKVRGIKFRFLKLQKILFPFIMLYYRNLIKDKKGLVVLEVPMLAEYSLAKVFNGDIIMVHLNEQEQRKRLMSRDKISQQQAQQKIILANNTKTKIKFLQKQINSYKYKNNLNLFLYNNDLSNKENILSFSKKVFINITLKSKKR